MWNGNHFGSSMISTGITGTVCQWMNANRASNERVNTFRPCGAAAVERITSRAVCDRAFDIVADHFEREIGLHARAHVEVAVVKERPAVMGTFECGAGTR